MPNHRVFSLRTGLALAATLLLLSVPALSGAATDSECSDEWTESAADGSCDNESISASGDTDCAIGASCTTGQGQGNSRYATITVHLERVDELHNCNGHLQVGSCSSGNQQSQGMF